jgi:PAS domain S-box-containing protein
LIYNGQIEKRLYSEQDKSEAGIELIEQALDSFNTASDSLKKYYGQLEQRVHELNVELEEERTYLSNVLQSLPVGIVVLDLKGRVDSLNRHALEMIGKGLDEMVGKPVDEIIPLSSWSFLQNNSNNSSVGDGGLEVELKREAGENLALLASSSFLKDRNGVVSGSLVFFQDVTDFKKLKERAERNRRLVAMGEMAAGIAHEMRNPLGSIELFASILRDDLTHAIKAHPQLDKGKDLLKISENISSGIKTLSSVLNNMLVFATQPRPRLKTVMISDLLNKSLNLLSPIVKTSFIEIVLKGTVNGVAVSGDEELLKQAFLNIIMNALQAMKEQKGGTLTIDVIVKRESYVEISFADKGVGISSGTEGRIFDPFFTTKARGSGLGLSIVKNIMKAHSGMVEVDGNVGKGAIIKLMLPLCIEKELSVRRVVNS